MNIQQGFQEIARQEGCLFCQGNSRIILFSTDNFVVGFDNYPLVEGHLLIYSKAHYGCGGEVLPELLKELAIIKEKIALLLEKTYGVVSFYEHGRAGHCVSFGPDERLCHHFHLHALPLTIDITLKIDEYFQKINVSSYEVIDTLFNSYGEYLFFENSKREASFYPVSTDIPPHFLRTLIAEGISKPERADWQHFNDKEFIAHAFSQAQIRMSV